MPKPTPEWSHCPQRKTPVHTQSVSTTKCLIGNVSALETCTYMKLPIGGKQPKCTPTLPGARSATTPRPTWTLKVNPECPLDKKKGRPNRTYIHITLPIHLYININKCTYTYANTQITLTSVCGKVYTGYQCVIKEQLFFIV